MFTKKKIKAPVGEVKYMQEPVYSKEEHIELEINICDRCKGEKDV